MRARTWDGDKMIYLKLGQCKDYEVDFVFRREDNLDGMWIDDHVGEVKWPFMLGSGLFDKNKNELFDRDFFKLGAEEGVFMVKFEHGCFLVYFQGEQYGILAELKDCFIERIGNIYETPELING